MIRSVIRWFIFPLCFAVFGALYMCSASAATFKPVYGYLYSGSDFTGSYVRTRFGVSLGEITSASSYSSGVVTFGSDSSDFASAIGDGSSYVFSGYIYLLQRKLDSYSFACDGYSDPVFSLSAVPALGGSRQTIYTFSSSEWSASYTSSASLMYKFYSSFVLSGVYDASTLRLEIVWPRSLSLSSVVGTIYPYFSSTLNLYTFASGTSGGGSSSGGSSGGSSSGGVSTSDIDAAADKIIAALGDDITDQTSTLIDIKTYLLDLYKWSNDAATVTVDGETKTIQYDWNQFVALTYEFWNKFLTAGNNMISNQTLIYNMIKDFASRFGYNYAESESGLNFEETMKLYYNGIISAIENQTTSILDALDTYLGSGADTAAADQASEDLGTSVESLDQTETQIYESVTSAINDVDLSSPSLGSQTLTALAALFPVYNSFYNSSGEVGLILVFGLALGLVLLCIGRAVYVKRNG